MSHDHAGHSHDHEDHGHTHVHAPASFGKAFAIGITLNLGFVIIEALYGLMSNSVSLLADAGHNLGDVLGLGVAWLASVLARRAPTERFTYGMRGSSMLSAFFHAVFLLGTVGGVFWGGPPASRIARTGGWQDDDGGRGGRHSRQRGDSLALRFWPQGRHQPARRV